MRRCLFVVLALALAAACAGDDTAGTTVTTASTTTTTSTSTTSTTTLPPTTTTTVAPLPEGTWHQVSHDNGYFGGGGAQTLWAVTAWDGGLIAVGQDTVSAAVWVSVDGTTWQRVPHNDAVFGGLQSQALLSIASLEGRLFGVGHDGNRGYADAAVWTSDDGIDWERVPHDEAVFGGHGDQVMRSVTTWEGGLVAAGTDHSGDDDAAIWISADGITWERVPHDEHTFGGFLYQGISSVTSWDGGLVAVGADQIAGDDDAVVWISNDGITWEWAPHDEAVFGGDEDQGMISVTAWAKGLIAVGYDSSGGDLDVAVWTSVDGVTWERVPQDEAVFGGDGDQHMSSITAWDGGLVAVGYDTSGEDWDAAIWVSADGINWQRNSWGEPALGGDGRQLLNSVSAWNGGLVAVGQEQVGSYSSSAAMDAAVWYWTPD